MTQALRSPSPNRQQRRKAAKQAKGAGRNATGAAKGTAYAAYLEQAVALHRGGAYDSAEAIYRQVLESEPENHQALQLLGTLLNQTGRNEAAIPLLQKAAQLAPAMPTIWNNLGAAYLNLGRIDEAQGSCLKALALRPDHADAHRNLGMICFQQERFAEALDHLERSLSSYAHDPRVLSFLAHASFMEGDLGNAADYYAKALSLQPDDPHMLMRIALVLTAAGRYADALVHLAKAIPHHPESRDLQRSLELALQAAPPQGYMPELEPALIVCMDSPFLSPKSLTRVAAHQIRLKYRQQARVEQSEATAGKSGTTKLHLDGILADQLLLRLLCKTVNTDPEFELFLTAIRRALLFSACRQATISPPVMAFMAALASQCHNNSYVFYSEPAETTEIDRLTGAIDERLSRTDKPDAPLETKLVLIAMYQPLSSLPRRGELEALSLSAWSAEMRPVIELALLNRLEEARLSTQIRTIADIDDEVSQAVQSQYEENPYPRWITLPDTEPCNFTAYIKQKFPSFDPPDFLADDIEVLVAGCGTGQHPISVALLYNNAHVTAVDLSRASLAYASRMAVSLGVNNIEFYQGDILGLAKLDRQLPVIECSGVLHHMRDPDAGLAVLADLLQPGGIMKLGLYSELARYWVVAARKRIAELGLKPTAENIRAFRRAVLTGRELSGSNLAGFGDLYDLDSCRDLIFHVQEHRFTIPLLKDFLERQSLRFIGFFFPKAEQVERFAKMFPNPAAATDLDCWQQFEEAHPYSFVSMYQFWCQKPL